MTNILSMTTYVVLRLDAADLNAGVDGLHRWELIGETAAYNHRAAIKSVTKDDGTYVAVPVRSWKPQTRSTETKALDVWS